MKEMCGTFGVRRWGSATPESREGGSDVFYSSAGTSKKIARPQLSEKIFETFPIGSGENK